MAFGCRRAVTAFGRDGEGVRGEGWWTWSDEGQGRGSNTDGGRKRNHGGKRCVRILLCFLVCWCLSSCPPVGREAAATELFVKPLRTPFPFAAWRTVPTDRQQNKNRSAISLPQRPSYATMVVVTYSLEQFSSLARSLGLAIRSTVILFFSLWFRNTRCSVCHPLPRTPSPRGHPPMRANPQHSRKESRGRDMMKMGCLLPLLPARAQTERWGEGEGRKRTRGSAPVRSVDRSVRARH